MHREFPRGASELLDSDDRRHFLKIMGASMALAGLGLAGCRRWPREEILPFARVPEGATPGERQHFATALELEVPRPPDPADDASLAAALERLRAGAGSPPRKR